MGFARVQNAGNGNNTNILTVTLGSTPTSGNLLIAWANSDATVTNNGSGWTAGPSVVDGNGAYFWWKIAGVSEPSSVTFSPSISDFICAGLLEYSGNTASPLDVSGSSTHSGTQVSSTVSVSVTTTTAHDLGVAVGCLHNFAQAAPTSPVWTNSWSNVQSQGDGGNRCYTFAADNLDLGAAGSISTLVSWSTTSWGDAQELLMTFKPATVTPPTWIPPETTPFGTFF